jgi:hypothetical protein
MNQTATATAPRPYVKTCAAFLGPPSGPHSEQVSVVRYSQTSTNLALRAIALYRSMLRDIPVLASAADLPLVAWS